MLDPKYFLELFQFVGEQMRVRTASAKKKQNEERRKLYKSEDWEAYKSLVTRTLEDDEAKMMTFVKEVTESLGITE